MRKTDAFRRAAALVAALSITVSLAAPAFAETYYIDDGDITITKNADGSQTIQQGNETHTDEAGEETIITNSRPITTQERIPALALWWRTITSLLSRKMQTSRRTLTGRRTQTSRRALRNRKMQTSRRTLRNRKAQTSRRAQTSRPSPSRQPRLLLLPLQPRLR